MSRLPSQEFLNKMFSLSQETHPERLFVLDKMGDTTGKVIYDMGCGRHKTVPNAIGVDIMPVTDIHADISDLPMIHSGTADIIISRHSLEHVIDPIKTLCEWKRILRPNGRIIIILPDFEAMDTMHPVLSGGLHLHAYTKNSFERMVGHIQDLNFIVGVKDVVPGWSFGSVLSGGNTSEDEESDTLDELSLHIKLGWNFSIASMGDGEMECMLGKKGENCDHQSYGERLAEALRESYKFMGTLPNVEISRWKLPGFESKIEHFEKELGVKCTADHDLFANRVGEITGEHYNFWKTIKESKRRKIFVGPERLSEVVNFLNIDIFKPVPQNNAFDAEMFFTPEKDDIFIFSAGLASKVWIAKILKARPDVTCIDAGSAFDPIFVGWTRTNQLPQAYLKEFYKPLLS